MIVAIMTTALSGTAWAEDVTFSSSDYVGEGTQGSGSSYTMTKTDVSITNTKFYGNTSYAHFYAGGTTTITPASGVTITKIVLTASATSYNGYQSSGTITASTGEVSGSGTTVTWTGSATAAFTLSNNKQIRWTSIVVTYTKAGGTPTCAAPTFLPAAGTYSSAQNVTISTTTEGATIYYTTNGTDPTTSSSVYSTPIAVSTTTTIKAMAVASGYENSSVASATYNIVTIEHAGTEADPYTVADARNAIDLGTGVTGVYATGVVSEIVTAYSSQFSNITFDIIDEGGSNTLRAYRCGGNEAANVQVGDVVVVSGNLTLYGTTYEFESGCTLVSRTSSSSQVAAGFSFSSNSAEADLADLSSFTAPTFSNPNNIAVTFTSSNTAVATVAQDGTVTPLAKGTTTITATSEETSEYLAGEASYTLTVTNSNAALVTVDADGNTHFDLSNNGWNFPTSKQVEEDTFTYNGYTITVAGSSGNGFYFYETSNALLLGKSGAYLTLPAFDYDVDKIQVVGSSAASTSVVQNIYVDETAVSTATTGAKDVTNTYLIDEEYQEAGTIYTLKVTSAHNTQITEIIVYKAPVIPEHTAKFSVNGVLQTSAEVQVKEGKPITFPANPADIGGKTFVGWTTAAIAGTTDTAPAFVTSATMGTADVTYYAVFATATSGGSSQESLEITATTEGVPSSYGTANAFTECTLEGVKFQIQQMYKNGGKLQWRAAGNSSGTGTMYNSESLGKIESIVLTYNSSDTNKNFTLTVGNSANPTEGETITPSSSNEVYTFDCSSFDYGFFVLTNGSGAGYVDKIVINYSASSITYSAYCTTVAGSIQEVEVKAAGYATFVAAANLEIPEGVEVFAVTVNDGAASAHLEAIESGIPAGEAVLVRANENTYEFVYASETFTKDFDNDLKAATVDFKPSAANTIYCLAKKGDPAKVGFYPVATTVTIPAGKAYLETTSGEAPVKGFYGFDMMTQQLSAL